VNPHPTLDRKRLIRDAQAGRVRRAENHGWLHFRTNTGHWRGVASTTGLPLSVRADRSVTELIAAGWLTEDPDGHARPTPLGLNIAGINTKATS
jgi:hypothetical protein